MCPADKELVATSANPGPVGVWPCGTESPGGGCARRQQRPTRWGTSFPKSSSIDDDLETTTRQTGSAWQLGPCSEVGSDEDENPVRDGEAAEVAARVSTSAPRRSWNVA